MGKLEGDASRAEAGGTNRAYTGVAKHEWLRARLLDDMERRGARDPLPAERELATRYGVSRSTVRQALDALEEAGTVSRIRGAGTFVVGPHISKTLSLTSFSEDMRARGLEPSSTVIAAGQVIPDTAVSEDLQVGAGESVVRLVRVRLADGSPMCLETVYLPAARVPGVLDHDLSGSIYAVLEDAFGLRILRADQHLQAMVAVDTEAALLDVAPGSPVLKVRRIGVDERGAPLERTTSVYRADRYDIHFAVRRSTP